MWMGLAGADLPYCSNFGVELLFALLCFAAPQSPHRLWMGIKHQVAGAPHSETDRLGWSIHHPRQTKQIAWPSCCCRTLSIQCMGLKKRRIYHQWHTLCRLYSHRNPGRPSPNPSPTPSEVKGHLWQSILGRISVPKLSAVVLTGSLMSYIRKQSGLTLVSKTSSPFFQSIFILVNHHCEKTFLQVFIEY